MPYANDKYFLRLELPLFKLPELHSLPLTMVEIVKNKLLTRVEIKKNFNASQARLLLNDLAPKMKQGPFSISKE